MYKLSQLDGKCVLPGMEIPTQSNGLAKAHELQAVFNFTSASPITVNTDVEAVTIAQG